MEVSDSQPTHIIIQGDGNSQAYKSDQSQGTFIVRVDNGSASCNFSDKNVLQKYITSSQERSRSNDANVEPSSMSFEIIQEPLSEDTLFDYSDFPHEESRFNERSEGDKTSSSLSPHARVDQGIPIEDRNEESGIQDIQQIDINSKKQNISESTDISRETLPVNTQPEPALEGNITSSIKTESQDTTKVYDSSKSFPGANEKTKDGDIIKKTIVEAFVKMVVCRKVTVQKVDSKTGAVLDVDVHTEEEEPVVLGVDCVETTEDVNTSNSTKFEAKLVQGTSSKFGTNVDGGLKFLSAVSESRQKINPSLIGSAFLQSSLPKNLSKALHSEKEISSSDKSSKSQLVDVKIENREEISELNSSELLDDLNDDDSADYIPNYERKLLNKGSSSFVKHSKTLTVKPSQKALNFEENVLPALPTGLEHEKSGSSILLPKKRGRKRRWDKALGLTANLKTCQFCNKRFDSVKMCTKHMKLGKCISALFCFICYKPFSSEEQLEKHIMSHGNFEKNTSFDCSDCHRSYRTKAGYMKHFRMGTCSKRDEFEDGETGDYACDLCESRFSTLDYLKLHCYKVHENPKDLHNCPDCGKKFHSFLGFQRHRYGRPCTEPLKCRVCGKIYKAKESFKLHMKHHKSEISGDTFDCETCGRSYMTQTALTKHKLSHTGVKPYKCETCGKEFAMRYQVKDHARMHTGERPYLCTLCGSAFSNKGHLGRHLRSHENGTLLRRGRPKKVREPEENSSKDTGLKLLDVGQTLQTVDGQTIQVVDSQMFDSSSNNTPMIIQADNNTIIIAEGWPANAVQMPQNISTNIPTTSTTE